MSDYVFEPSDFSGEVDVGGLYDELRYDFDFVSLLSITMDDGTGNVTISFSVDLTTAQIESLETAIAAHEGVPRLHAAKHVEEEYDGPRQVRETWYARRLANGDLVQKFSEMIYAYDGGRRMGETLTLYARDGSTISERSWEYMTRSEGTTRYIRKVEV